MGLSAFDLLAPLVAQPRDQMVGGSVSGTQKGEYEGSYMQDLVRTYFNPDRDPVLVDEARSVAAYIGQNAKDLIQVFEDVSLDLAQIQYRNPRLKADEFRRRLQPFVAALNAEVEIKNDAIAKSRRKMLMWSVAGGGLLGVSGAAIWYWKSKSPKPRRKKLNTVACIACGGVLCGLALGSLGSILIGESLPRVDPQNPLLPIDDDSSKSSASEEP